MMAFTGATPLGALLAGALGGALGPSTAVAVMSLSVIAVAAATAALRLPAGTGTELPSAPDDWPEPSHAPSVPGSPVAVLVTWTVDADDRDDFLAAMQPVRRSRLPAAPCAGPCSTTTSTRDGSSSSSRCRTGTSTSASTAGSTVRPSPRCVVPGTSTWGAVLPTSSTSSVSTSLGRPCSVSSGPRDHRATNPTGDPRDDGSGGRPPHPRPGRGGPARHPARHPHRTTRDAVRQRQARARVRPLRRGVRRRAVSALPAIPGRGGCRTHR